MQYITDGTVSSGSHIRFMPSIPIIPTNRNSNFESSTFIPIMHIAIGIAIKNRGLLDIFTGTRTLMGMPVLLTI